MEISTGRIEDERKSKKLCTRSIILDGQTRRYEKMAMSDDVLVEIENFMCLRYNLYKGTAAL